MATNVKSSTLGDFSEDELSCVGKNGTQKTVKFSRAALKILELAQKSGKGMSEYVNESVIQHGINQLQSAELPDALKGRISDSARIDDLEAVLVALAYELKNAGLENTFFKNIDKMCSRITKHYPQYLDTEIRTSAICHELAEKTEKYNDKNKENLWAFALWACQKGLKQENKKQDQED